MPTQKIITEEEEVEVLGTTPGRQGDSDEDQGSTSGEEEGEDANSVTTEVVKPPTKFDPTAYIDLTSRDICRAVYTVSFKSQKKRVKLVCGRVGCRFHTEAEERAKGRFYIRQSRGGFDHGRADLPSLSKREFDEAYDEFAAQFQKDIGSISQEQTIEFEEKEDDKKKAPTTPSDPPMSSFARAFSSFVSPRSATPKKSITVEEGATVTPKKSVTVDEGATTIRKANSDSEAPSPSTPNIIYGLESNNGERKITWDANFAMALHDTVDWEFRCIWRTHAKALRWVKKAPVGLGEITAREDGCEILRPRSNHETPPVEPKKQTTEETTEDPPTKKKKTRSKKKKKKDDSSSSDSDSSGGKKTHKSSKVKKKKSSAQKKKEADTSSSNRSSSDSSSSPSSDPSSSDDSSSDSESSTSSSDESRRRRKKGRKAKKSRKERKKKKGKKKDKEDRKSRKAGPVLHGRASSDPSTGSDDKVHGRHLTDPKLDRKLCPPGMPSKEREEFTDLLLDVTHLPGMYNGGTDVGELNEVIGELKGVGDAIISATKHRKTKTQLNTQWANERRTMLLKISNEDQLLEAIDRIITGEKPAFKKQTYAIHTFMRRCLYRESDISKYLRNGLWPRIIEDTFKWNLEFLEQVRRISTKHKTWSGLAYEMVRHHGRKLADIRNFAVDYRLYLLEVYVYFREHRKTKFQSPSIQEALWRPLPSRIADTYEDNAETGPTPSRSGCAHCKSKALHEVMGVGLGQANCPLKEVSRNQARQMVGELLGYFKKNPNCDKSEHLKKKIMEVKDK